jgi:glycerol-3-phosphate acyltransferase PlsY
MELLGLYLYAYLVGSFPTTYIIGKLLRGVDIRRYGSGNVGVTNLSHHVGKRWLAPLILFEMLVKGASPVLVGRFLLGLELASLTLALVGLLTIAGNNWSVFLRFKGGRGIAVAGGTLLALTPLALVGFAIVFFPGGY